MRLVLALAAMGILFYAYADGVAPSVYESVYQSCAEFGSVALTPKQKEACHEAAKSEVLSSFQKHQEYIDCMDYGHTPDSMDKQKEIQCLKLISKK